MTQATVTGPTVLPDLPDAQDKLDFAPYANTLRNIILNSNTQTPLTIGIFGSWGSGKTSLMKMIQNGLKRAARSESERETRAIWFNAWLYSKEDSLWRALIMQVLAGVRKWRSDDPAAIKDLDELAEHLHRAVGPAELGHLSITAANLLKEKGADSAELTLTLQHGLDMLESVAQARQQGQPEAAVALRDQVQRATAALEQERIEALDKFQQNFRELIKKYVLPYGCLVLFVDDLDRCLPDKAVEVLEAIKLFLDVPGCIFILGIDRDVVERGIRLRYGEMGADKEGDDVIDGGRYLEKIIQLPFVLPPISPDAMGKFIATLAPGLPDPECGLVFAQGLEPNPRQVKRAINIFTLMWELSRNKQELAPLIEPVRLAKLVVIQQRHSELYEMLRDDPAQLIAWETFFRRQQDHAGFTAWEREHGGAPSSEVPLPQAVASYDLLPALETLLTMHSLDGEAVPEANFVNLSPDEARTYVFLTRTVKESISELIPTSPPVPPPVTVGDEILMEPLEEKEGVYVELGAAASKRGFITGMIYSELDSLSDMIAKEGGFSPSMRPRVLTILAGSGSQIYSQIADDFKGREELAEPTLIHLPAEQSEVQIPWEIVYDQPDLSNLAGWQEITPESPEFNGFWGFKHVIERPLMTFVGKGGGYKPPPPEIPVRGRPVVTLGLDRVSPQFEKVRATFEQWATQDLIDLLWLDYPSDFRDALMKRPTDVYVLHGRGGTEGGEIWFDFGKERVTRRTLESWRTGKKGSALFYLDVSAALGRGSDWWAWLDLLQNMGGGGVIAPLATPHPSWSSNFMLRFMEMFLDGDEAGPALREARREFFEETGNPLGLFYAHFGPAAQRLIHLDEDETAGE